MTENAKRLGGGPVRRTLLAWIHSLRLRSAKGAVGLAAIILIVGYVSWHYASASQTDAGNRQTKGPAPIPVTVESVQNSDFPVYLNGLGTVQPYDTVTVRSRVDGPIIKVEFQQGRMVKQGDVLVQVDPRPYQAALTQAESKKAQDEANLKNAKLNL